MIISKVHKQPRPETVLRPKNPPGNVTMTPGTRPSEDMIRERAYELYEGRGREPGQHEQDWLRAEQDILRHGG